MPAFVSRQPFLFADTTAYVRGADAVVITLTGSRSEWSGEVAGPPSKPVPMRPVLAGRSIYYGLGLWLSQAAGGFWAIIAVQAFLTCAAIALVVGRTVDAGRGERLLVTTLLIGALSVATPLAFFASFAMPDIFAALALIAVGMLAMGKLSPTLPEKAFWAAIVGAACLFHSANIITIAAVGFVLLAVWIGKLAPISRQGLALSIAGVALGLAGEAAFSVAVERALGAPPIRPPFMMARVIDDGPGYRHLRDVCVTDTDPFVICRFLPLLPQPSDTFLWSVDPRSGVFMASSPGVQRALAAEQYRFVGSVFADRPFEQLSASLRSAIRQSAMIGLSEFNYDPGTRQALMRKLPPDEASKQRRSMAFRGVMPVRATEIMTYLTVAAAILILWLGRACLRAPGGRTLSPLGGLALVLITGIAINDLVCGAMSTPHDRYAARVVWLLPLVAALIVHVRYRDALRERRSHRPASRDAVEFPAA